MGRGRGNEVGEGHQARSHSSAEPPRCPFLMGPRMFWASACLDENTLPDSLAAGGGHVSQVWAGKAVAEASEKGL